jgi:hypothetical protein
MSQPVEQIAELLRQSAESQGPETPNDPPADQTEERQQPPADQAAAPEQPDQGGTDADLVGADADLGIGNEPPAAPAGDPGEPPKTLAEAAARLGIEASDLYGLTIPMREGDAETLTLGELKDIGASASGLEADRAALDERQRDIENSMLRAQQELQAIVSLLPHVPESLIAKATQAQTDMVNKERHALLTIKPEWRDDATWQRAQDDILEAVADYGFTRSDLDMVFDHRLTKLLHDYAGLRKRVEAANANAKKVRSSQARPGQRINEKQQKAQATAAAVGKAKTGDRRAQTEAVGRLLQGNQT